MTPGPIKTASYHFRYARELEGYEVRVFAVNALGTLSAPAEASITTGQHAPQNTLNHWTEDFSKTGYGAWIPPTAPKTVTVTGTAGSQQLVFSGSDVAIEQHVPSLPLNGRDYTLHVQM